MLTQNLPPPMASTQVIADVRALVDLLASADLMRERLAQLEAAQTAYADTVQQQATAAADIARREAQVITAEAEIVAGSRKLDEREKAFEAKAARLSAAQSAHTKLERETKKQLEAAEADLVRRHDELTIAEQALKAAQARLDADTATTDELKADLTSRLEKLRAITNG